MLLCVAVGLTGCAKGSKEPAGEESGMTAEATTSDGAVPAAPEAAPAQVQAPGWATTPLPGGAGPVAVKEGPAPLVYLAESPGTFRVHDATDRRDLARAQVTGRTIVRVDRRGGVVAGSETLLAGPLPADHRYVIYYEPAGQNFSRQGTFQPRPRR